MLFRKHHLPPARTEDFISGGYCNTQKVRCTEIFYISKKGPFTVDLSEKYHFRVMFIIVPDFNMREWERSLEEILLMDFKT